MGRLNLSLNLNQITLSNIFYYLQGYLRYYIWYRHKRFLFLIPRYVRKQIAFRLLVMDQSCYKQGECKMCGCHTTALQMASKACDKPCYPPMVSAKKWYTFMATGYLKHHNNVYIAVYQKINGSSYRLFKLSLNGIVKHEKVIDTTLLTESM